MTKRYVVALLASLLLAACASTPSSRSPTEIDLEYVNAVERHAGHAGVDVQWVNPPTRKRDTDDQG
ncbi:hypothetical protein [Wenzhouxiangella sp. EGI_FJ10305]|uniref:hypothetical protein n=1 Tax=Wenzhouxiangella sp. EGI_FJ10305 TaxID=3243768 RepID=UPI0035D7B343